VTVRIEALRGVLRDWEKACARGFFDGEPRNSKPRAGARSKRPDCPFSASLPYAHSAAALSTSAVSGGEANGPIRRRCPLHDPVWGAWSWRCGKRRAVAPTRTRRTLEETWVGRPPARAAVRLPPRLVAQGPQWTAMTATERLEATGNPAHPAQQGLGVGSPLCAELDGLRR